MAGAPVARLYVEFGYSNPQGPERMAAGIAGLREWLERNPNGPDVRKLRAALFDLEVAGSLVSVVDPGAKPWG